MVTDHHHAVDSAEGMSDVYQRHVRGISAGNRPRTRSAGSRLGGNSLDPGAPDLQIHRPAARDSRGSLAQCDRVRRSKPRKAAGYSLAMRAASATPKPNRCTALRTAVAMSSPVPASVPFSSRHTPLLTWMVRPCRTKLVAGDPTGGMASVTSINRSWRLQRNASFSMTGST